MITNLAQNCGKVWNFATVSARVIKTAMNAETEAQLLQNWAAMQNDPDFPESVCNYLATNWWPYKEQWAMAYRRRCQSLGMQASSIAEAWFSVLKRRNIVLQRPEDVLRLIMQHEGELEAREAATWEAHLRGPKAREGLDCTIIDFNGLQFPSWHASS
jgi:hypothetical protein